MKTVFQPTLTLIAAAAVLAGCASGGGGATNSVPSPYTSSGGTGLGEVRVNTMRVFGDSYSDLAFTNRVGTNNWTATMAGSGLVNDLDNFALGGARASSGEERSFDRQIGRFESSNKPIAAGDLTVVYFGYNDIGRTGSPDGLARSGAAYRSNVARLVADGAATDGSKLFLTQIHAWGRGPGVSDGVGSQVSGWNTMIAGVANSNPNIVAVDMFTVFERIFETPQAYGFTNVTTADPSRSANDALYNDATHFGNRGQDIIARVYTHYLTRGWDWANSIAAGAESASRLNDDIDQGTLVLGLSQQKSLTPTLRLLPLGVKDNPGQRFAFQNTASKVFQPFATAASTQSQAPTGLALDMQLGQTPSATASRLGVALFQKAQPQQLTTNDLRTSKQYTSDAMALYWNKPLNGFQLSSQLAHVNLGFTSHAEDGLVARTLENKSQGNTWSLESKVRRPMQSGALGFTPWLSLTGQSHDLKAATVQTLYTTDAQFSSKRVNEWLTGLGFDLQSKPLYLGGNRVSFGASVRHTYSLRRDATRVAISEAGLPGVVQRDSFANPTINRTQVNLQANMDLGKRVQLSATYGTTLQDAKRQGSAVLSANVAY